VHVVSSTGRRHEALAAGALAVVQTPVTQETLAEAFAEMAGFIDRRVRNLLIVEDDDVERASIAELIGAGDDVAITAVGTEQEALAALAQTRFDCMVLDLKLPDTTGFALLEKLKKDKSFHYLPVIIYTGKDLTAPGGDAAAQVRRDDHRQGRQVTRAAARRDGAVPAPRRGAAAGREAAHDRAAARRRGHLPRSQDPDRRRRHPQRLRADQCARAARHQRRLRENGREGIETLEQNADVDLVLMDVMMPEMDGYATTEAIRRCRRSAGCRSSP
jgi:CheY-like chemotaxis protein